MREIIAICSSKKRAEPEVARILDHYFSCIGNRTWYGSASNVYLDRVSKEIHKTATRNTSVVIYEIPGTHESRVPIIRIGNRHAFSETGIAPVAAWPAQLTNKPNISNNKPVVQIAALFHDLGKATRLFQNKLACVLKNGSLKADAIRHELYSVAVWDYLFGNITDNHLRQALLDLTPERIDAACLAVCDILDSIFYSPGQKPLPFSFLKHDGCHCHAIGMLILTHHRLPKSGSNLISPFAEYHINSNIKLDSEHDLEIANGFPFWHEIWWRDALHRAADHLKPGTIVSGLDLYLRAALMMGDHLGSAQKKSSCKMPDHLANTISQKGQHPLIGDSLSRHTRRVHSAVRHGVDLFERYTNRFPALGRDEIPARIAFPKLLQDPRFQWQTDAAKAAHTLCKSNEGGFFACLMAGTGTGKTRGAPTILAAAAFADTHQERRYFRMNLGLGLRVLATQSAHEYVSDLGFNDQNVSVFIGQVPLVFKKDEEHEISAENGSESLIDIPEWLRVEMAIGEVPEQGDKNEEKWLRGLSLDTGKRLPAFCEILLRNAGNKGDTGRQLLTSPIMVGTIDHLMGVAAPVNSRFILQSLRVATADLILDEIDQFDGEDIAAIGRLVYQTAVAGRRVIIMSATLTPDIAIALHTAYISGWSQFASAHGIANHVNLLVTGDAWKSCRTNGQGETIEELLKDSTDATIHALEKANPARRGEILPVCNNWYDLVEQIDDACHYLHDLNAIDIDGYQVSFGMIRMTRIAHTAALAVQIPSGKTDRHLRVVLCLHSQFPRLHRGWIEKRLKDALTRQGNDSHSGLRRLCYNENLFKQADEAKTRNIEIVLVTSPVIETGNDLDFDWAILDPISTRSIIQAAGRVWRHRPVNGNRTNVMILGRSPIAIQSGKLEMPGVETRISTDTRIQRPSLSKFKNRHFMELMGDADFSVINATPILKRNIDFPLRDAEHDLREKFIAAESDDARKPLGCYIRHVAARMTRRIFDVRQFRRSIRKSIIVACVGEDFETADWHMDLAPRTYQSELRPVNLDTGEIKGCHLFKSMTEPAWHNLLKTGKYYVSSDVGDLMRVEIPDYNGGFGLEAEPHLTYIEFTGFTRGSFEDLFQPFGKIEKRQ